MKNKLGILILAGVVFACSQKQEQKSETIKEVVEAIQTYGEKFDAKDVVKTANLATYMAANDSSLLTLSGEIEETCTKKGCWMTLKLPNDETIRVTFKDYGFFVPKEGQEGKLATVNGYCVMKEQSVDELKHYAEDAGKSLEEIAQITEAVRSYTFVADGVTIQ